MITGASQGLGLDVAKILAQKQVKLILTGRSFDKLKTCLATLEAFENLQYELLVGDLTSNESLADMLSTLDAKDLTPDIIVHSLGGKIDGDKQPLHPEILDASIRLNLGVAAQINTHFLPRMSTNKRGCIVHVSSDASISGEAAPGYSAAKAAINAYVKSTARYYSKNQVLICAVLPGIFEHVNSAWTLKKATDPVYYQQKLERMPLGRFLSSTEVAEVICDIVFRQNMVYSGSLLDLACS